MNKEQNDWALLRKSIYFSFLIVFGASVLGLLLGYSIALYHTYNEGTSKVLGYIGLMFVLWAAIFTKDWRMQSCDNGTKQESWYQFIYRSLAFIGTLLCAIPITWSWGN